MNKSQLKACTDHITPAWHLATVDCMPVETLYLTDTFFPGMDTFDRPEVQIKRRGDGVRPLGFFTCECATGRERTLDLGYTVDTFEPASIKERMTLSPCDEVYDWLTFDEDNNNPMTWAQRFEDAAAEGDRQMAMAKRRRVEWMAAETLVKGEYVVEGHEYPKRTVGFKRDPNLTGTFEGDDAWDSKGMNIKRLGRQIAWLARLVSRIGCAKVDKITLGSVAADKLICLDDWMKWICCDNNNGGVVMPLNFRAGATHLMPVDGVQNLGDILSIGVNVCVYDEWYDGCYTDPATGLSCPEPTPYVPPNGMIITASGAMNGGNSGLQGRTLYGAIKDVHAIGLGPRGAGDVPEFFKSDVDFDLGCLKSVMISKPLVVPYNINASAYFEVCPMTDEDTEQMEIRRDTLSAARDEREAAAEEKIDALKASLKDNYARDTAELKRQHAEEIAALRTEVEQAKQAAAATGSNDPDPDPGKSGGGKRPAPRK